MRWARAVGYRVPVHDDNRGPEHDGATDRRHVRPERSLPPRMEVACDGAGGTDDHDDCSDYRDDGGECCGNPLRGQVKAQTRAVLRGDVVRRPSWLRRGDAAAVVLLALTQAVLLSMSGSTRDAAAFNGVSGVFLGAVAAAIGAAMALRHFPAATEEESGVQAALERERH